MQRILICTVGASILLCVLVDAGFGQFVRVGPDGSVHVRAPFTRVYVGPGGGASVRPPFAPVYAPGLRFFPAPPFLPPGVSPWPYDHPDASAWPHDTARPQPTLADPALLDWQALRRMLRNGTLRLEEELDRLPTGEGWKRQLQTTELRELLPDDVDRPPDPQTAHALREALQQYEDAKANEGFRRISSLDGFVTVHRALVQLVVPPWERGRRQLAHSAQQLDQELMRFKTGPGWVRHLRLPDEVFVENSFTDVPAQEPASHDSTVVAGLDPLIDALGRFEAVSANPDYRVVSKLPAFKTTHQRLSGYLDLLSEAPEDIPLEGPLLELVPTPEPVED